MNSKDWSLLLKKENGTLGTISIKRRYLQYLILSQDILGKNVLLKDSCIKVWSRICSSLT